MFKFAVVIFAVIACAAAKPGFIAAPLAYTAPAGVVTATSSQVIERNYNGIATAPVVAHVAAPVVAKYATAYTAPVAAAYTSPIAAYSSPLAYSAPLSYSAPVVAKYAAAYSHPLAYSAPLTYAAAPAPVLFNKLKTNKMFKIAVVIFAVIACAAAKPGLIGAPLAYAAPAAVVAAPAGVVTATSSQYIARNHNGIATSPIVAPVAAPVAAYTAPVVAKYATAYSTPLAYSSPLAYSAPVVAKYAAAYSHPLAYSSPLTYAAAPAPVFF
ncbi:cuticle protein 38-like [Calliphora vicina]|uniref:cuticle protein 38-like n=1 Tax=Calliphora vicina TaxID=7373 RepID=UPI00325BF2BF